MPKFIGKHTRFEYNSDGELVGEVEIKYSAVASPSVLHLKGLPTPKREHLRFQQEKEEEMPEFTGKHTRFEYNSDGELVGKVESKYSAVASPSVLHLKGLPTPKRKHLQFQQEEEEEMPKFTGKHTRFEYNSDGELVGEAESKNSAVASTSVLHLKGLPTPKGKHLRFQQEKEEEM